MAYRDEVDRVLRENHEIRRALEKARADARITAFRQVLLAFAFGLSWSVLGEDASAREPEAVVRYERPPVGFGWLEVRPFADSTFDIDDATRGRGPMRIAVVPGMHRVRFHGRYGDHCAVVSAKAGEAIWATETAWRCP
jgi:hypothetical protein